ncbi:MAG: hypothetical protein L6R42_001873 [Xanthoria sp. 1 TBL-2021]|nr:MAG: hypothetical protein L6R42_001873 [Xanthoria sp. 1 TBL-2021]
MLSRTATHMVLVALPALINAQSLTTYFFSIGDRPTSIVVPIPEGPATTVYVTMPVATVTRTTAFAQSVATQTIVVTAPVGQISSIANGIPSSYVVPPVSNIDAAAVVPISFNGYTTSLNLPSSASVPTGAVTLTPIIVAPPPASTIQTVIDSLTASLANGASSIANDASTLAGGIASSANAQASTLTSQAAEFTSTAVAQASSITSQVQESAISAIATASSSLAASSSNAASALESAQTSATSALGAATSQATSLANEATSSAAEISSSIAAAASSAIPSPLPTGLVIDTSSFTTSTRTSITVDKTTTISDVPTTSTSTTEETSTSTAEETSTSQAAATTSSAPENASTAAPPASGVGRLGAGGVMAALMCLGAVLYSL